MDEDELNKLSLEEAADDIPFSNHSAEPSGPIDEDIQHMVGRLLQSQHRSRMGVHREPKRENGSDNKRENGSDNKRENGSDIKREHSNDNVSIESVFSKALQAERNHWKERLQMSMHEIDRQHKIILTTQAGLQDLVKSLKHSMQKQAVFDEEEEDSNEDIDHEVVSARLIENLKFQVRQLRVRAGVSDVTRGEIEEHRNKNKMIIKELKDKIEQLEDDKESLELDLKHKAEKVAFLQKDNSLLHRQIQKLQKIVAKYNETHSGANFHLNAVEKVDERPYNKKSSLTSLDLSETVSSASNRRERTYIEGDQLVSYPSPLEESAIIKDRLRRNIYSARQAKNSSNNVAQCLRCQVLFKPPENTRKSCQFHHKGREIKEQFLDNGKLEKVEYKWACCKKPLGAPGCCFGYHV